MHLHSFFIYINLFIYLFIFGCIGLRLRCWAQASSSCSERGLLFIAVRGLLTVVTSLVAEHGLQASGLQQLWSMGLVAPHVGSSQTRARTHVPCIGRQFLTLAPPGKSRSMCFIENRSVGSGLYMDKTYDMQCSLKTQVNLPFFPLMGIELYLSEQCCHVMLFYQLLSVFIL